MGKVGLIVGGVFMPIGLTFVGIALYLADADRDLAAKGGRAEGIVIELSRYRSSEGSTLYRPIVAFRDRTGQSQQFASDVSSSSPGYSEGERVAVVYDPANPADAAIDSFFERHFGSLIFGFLGSVFALVGGGILLATWRRRRIIAELRRNGHRITATVIGCERDTGLKINGRHPFRVSAQAIHPATGKLASFLSEPIWVDLTAILKGRSVPVLIDPASAGRHYIDLSEWVDRSEQA